MQLAEYFFSFLFYRDNYYWFHSFFSLRLFCLDDPPKLCPRGFFLAISIHLFLIFHFKSTWQRFETVTFLVTKHKQSRKRNLLLVNHSLTPLFYQKLGTNHFGKNCHSHKICVFLLVKLQNYFYRLFTKSQKLPV